jgi:hypothetical protein
MHPIFTYGYQGHTPDQLAAYLDATGAILLDIRFKPYSRMAGWGGDALKRQFGDRYRWMGVSLGNPNYQGGPITLGRPEQALVPVQRLLTERPVILLCACWNVETCHRKVAAEYLGNNLGAEVQHLPGRFSQWQQGAANPGDSATARALSLWQPWASLIGVKMIETRSWGSPYRGPVLIHAAKRFEYEERAICLHSPFSDALSALGFRTLGDLPLGAFVAVADLVACERMTADDIPERLVQHLTATQPGWNATWERQFGCYEAGRSAWLFANVRRLAQPIPARGQQGLWPCDLPAEVLSAA